MKKKNITFEEKLGPITQELFSIKNELSQIQEKLDIHKVSNNEDISILNAEIEKLKKRLRVFERELEHLKKEKVKK
jgi:predicted  nucleic acid-binding Zn-ribbon protein